MGYPEKNSASTRRLDLRAYLVLLSLQDAELCARYRLAQGSSGLQHEGIACTAAHHQRARFDVRDPLEGTAALSPTMAV